MNFSTAQPIQSFETSLSRWREAVQGSVVHGPEHGRAAAEASGGESLRDLVGNFVGNVFYGTLLRELQNSTLKGKYLHGGRGEEVFRGQLNMEVANRMGRAPNDPIANHMYEAMMRFYRLDSGKDALDGPAAASKRGGA